MASARVLRARIRSSIKLDHADVEYLSRSFCQARSSRFGSGCTIALACEVALGGCQTISSFVALSGQMFFLFFARSHVRKLYTSPGSLPAVAITGSLIEFLLPVLPVFLPRLSCPSSCKALPYSLTQSPRWDGLARAFSRRWPGLACRAAPL